MVGSLYKLTSSGRKVASSTNPNRRDELLDYLYRTKGGATVEELCAVTGMPKGTLLSLLSRYRGRGYIKDVTGGLE